MEELLERLLSLAKESGALDVKFEFDTVKFSATFPLVFPEAPPAPGERPVPAVDLFRPRVAFNRAPAVPTE